MSRTTKTIKPESTEKPWWKLDASAWLLIAVAMLCSIVLCLWPTLLDRLWVGFWYLAEYRQWAWWYFVEIVVVVGFAVRWFLLYIAHDNDELTPGQRTEATAFVKLTGLLAMTMFLLTVLHRAGIVHRARYALHAWLGLGAFSFVALLSFGLLLALLMFFIVLLWKWLTALKTDS